MSANGLLLCPSDKTLAKYGLSKAEWAHLAWNQGGVCSICKGLPKSGRLHIDHEHRKGWRKLPPEQRKRYVRSLACFRCNSQFMRRGLTTALAKSVFDCLAKYDKVKP